MRTCIAGLSLFISGICWSQVPVRTILDRVTGAPVAYATIKVLHSPKGEIASGKGEFLLLVGPSDTIMITSVGYERSVLPSAAVGPIIYMDPKTGIMDKVVAQKTRLVQTLFLGNGKDFINKALPCKYDGKGPLRECWPWGPSESKEEFAEKVALPDSSRIYKLKKVFIPTRRNNRYQPILLRVYAEDMRTGLPGEEIMVKLVEVTPKIVEKNKIVVDLSGEHLFMIDQKVVFISVGWPAGARQPDSTALAFYLSEKDNSYARHLMSATYEWHSFGHLNSVNGKQKKIGTFYSIEIEERVRQ